MQSPTHHTINCLYESCLSQAIYCIK